MIFEHRQELWDQLLVEAWIDDKSMPSVLRAYRSGIGELWDGDKRSGHDIEFLKTVKRS